MTRPCSSRNRYTPGSTGMAPGAGRYVDGSATSSTLRSGADTGRRWGGGTASARVGAARGGAQPATTWSPCTVTGTPVSGCFAGLSAVGAPVATANRLLWQGQTMKPSLTCVTAQPWCGQRVEKPLNCPAVGWVTTTLADAKTAPPPTGTSAVAPSGPLTAGAAAAPPSSDEPPSPQAVSAAPAAAMPTAPCSTARRLGVAGRVTRAPRRAV